MISDTIFTNPKPSINIWYGGSSQSEPILRWPRVETQEVENKMENEGKEDYRVSVGASSFRSSYWDLLPEDRGCILESFGVSTSDVYSDGC